jgi:uncharacterized phage protein (TIGR01671 family)
MNREIKFRAWIREVKEMISVESIYYDGFGGFEISGEGYNDMDHLEVVLMQFTGLHDKNGKEIYEGDIVSVEFTPIVSNYIGNSPNTHTMTCEVVFHNGGFKFKNLNKGKGRKAWPHKSLVDSELDEIEIIENIYENPDLLT